MVLLSCSHENMFKRTIERMILCQRSFWAFSGFFTTANQFRAWAKFGFDLILPLTTLTGKVSLCDWETPFMQNPNGFNQSTRCGVPVDVRVHVANVVDRQVVQ